MFSKNILFKNFQFKRNIRDIKKINKILKKELILNASLFSSLSTNYKYSFKKSIIKKYNNYQNINLIGMGGSILGTEAIHDFLKFKIKKKIKFFNNLNNQIKLDPNRKSINLIISKSGNTLETVSNFNLILKYQKKNKNIVIT